MKGESGFVGTGVAASLLGIPRHRLIWLLDTSRLPEPALKLPGRRLFAEQDIKNLRDALVKLNADKLKAQKAA